MGGIVYARQDTSDAQEETSITDLFYVHADVFTVFHRACQFFE